MSVEQSFLSEFVLLFLFMKFFLPPPPPPFKKQNKKQLWCLPAYLETTEENNEKVVNITIGLSNQSWTWAWNIIS